MATIQELKWQSLTRAVNEMKSPAQAVRKRVFSAARTFPTEDMELGTFVKEREIAPFVKSGSEGIMVPGHGKTFLTIAGTNIRIKRPFEPNQLLFARQPGTPIFVPEGQDQTSAVREHIARDLQVMEDMIVNTEELMCCQALQGVISYSAAEDHFQVTFPRNAGNTIVLTTFWNDANQDLPQIELNVLAAKRQVNDRVGLNLTDCFLGATAASQFIQVLKHQKLMDQRRFETGVLDLTTQYQEDGVIFLGRIFGINWWEYSRTVLVNGVVTNLIRPKYAEFVAVSPAAEFQRYYAAIPDMKAFQSGLLQSQRFAKSWEVEDPSAIWALIHSRPLPVLRRPDATLSMKVISGV